MEPPSSERRATASVPRAGGRRYLTVPEISDRLHVADKTVRKWIHAGVLEASRFGGEWRIHEEAFARFEAAARFEPSHATR